MEIKDMNIEDLELMSYTDISYKLLKENKKTMSTPELFKVICDLLDYSNSQYENKIGDFYTSLALDKRFVLVDNAWDICDNHSIEVEDEDEEDEEEIEPEEIEESIEDDYSDDDFEDSLEDEEMDEELEELGEVDLTIISEDELD